MTKQLALPETTELDKLAREINEAHHEVAVSFSHSLKHAIHAGELLNKAKDKCPHGTWITWHDKNIRHSIDLTEKYRFLANNKAVILANAEKYRYLGWDAAVRLLKGGTPMLQSMSNEWWTPLQYIEAVREVMGEIDLDPATCVEANKTVGARKFYTEDSDGLSQRWAGRVFLNPPYGSLGSAFASKLYESIGSGVTEAIMLVNSRATDADWFQPCFDGTVCFTDHRIDFDAPDEKTTSSTHGSCFVYFGPNKERFAHVFSKFGNIVRRWPQSEA